LDPFYLINPEARAKEIKRYKSLLKKIAKAPDRESFYCLPADEKYLPIPLAHKYSLDEDYITAFICPRCSHTMEESEIERGCGSIRAFYCHHDNLHWVWDCYGLKPPGYYKWYGPFPCNPGKVVKWVYMEKKAGEFREHLRQSLPPKKGKIVLKLYI
jgi:hypothetical protein